MDTYELPWQLGADVPEVIRPCRQNDLVGAECPLRGGRGHYGHVGEGVGVVGEGASEAAEAGGQRG